MYIFDTLLVYCFFIDKEKRTEIMVISLFLMAFFVREQTFSTMFDSKVIQLSTLFLVAFLQSKRVECEREKKNFPVILCFLPCIVMTYVVGLVLYNWNSKECFSLWSTEQFFCGIKMLKDLFVILKKP